jgi:hypothetical protein
MTPDPQHAPEFGSGSQPRRLFLREPGWRVATKTDSAREFCYAMAPGQDFYHRLSESEIIVVSPEEKLCLACAQRRGLLADQAKPLRESIHPRAPSASSEESSYDLVPLHDVSRNGDC